MRVVVFCPSTPLQFGCDLRSAPRTADCVFQAGVEGEGEKKTIAGIRKTSGGDKKNMSGRFENLTG